jgi:hypothetical protein
MQISDLQAYLFSAKCCRADAQGFWPMCLLYAVTHTVSGIYGKLHLPVITQDM